MKTEKLSIKHSFTDAERLQLGEDQSNALMQKDTLEAQLSATSKQMKANIEECQAKIRGISSRLSARYEIRAVECILMDQRVPGMRHAVRTDTGHITIARKLRPDEMQMELSEAVPEGYVAIGMFPVDADNIESDFLELHVLNEEFEALRGIDGLRFRPLPAALIGDAKANHKEARKKKE